jgi:hypothetical protein
MTPAERHSKIALYQEADELLTSALNQFPKEMWQYKPGPDRWSLHEIIVHIADSEANSYIRCRSISSRCKPPTRRGWLREKTGSPIRTSPSSNS